MLPVVPFSQQAAFFSGSATDGVQRWGASLALTVLLSKASVRSGPASWLGRPCVYRSCGSVLVQHQASEFLSLLSYLTPPPPSLLCAPGGSAGGHLADLAAVVALGAGRPKEPGCAAPVQVRPPTLLACLGEVGGRCTLLPLR